MRVQLKSRLTIDQKYEGKNLHMAFPINGGWCLIDHDLLVKLAGENANWLNTGSWLEKGQYHSASPSQKLIQAINEYVFKNT